MKAMKARVATRKSLTCKAVAVGVWALLLGGCTRAGAPSALPSPTAACTADEMGRTLCRRSVGRTATTAPTPEIGEEDDEEYASSNYEQKHEAYCHRLRARFGFFQYKACVKY